MIYTEQTPEFSLEENLTLHNIVKELILRQIKVHKNLTEKEDSQVQTYFIELENIYFDYLLTKYQTAEEEIAKIQGRMITNIGMNLKDLEEKYPALAYINNNKKMNERDYNMLYFYQTICAESLYDPEQIILNRTIDQ